MKLKEQNPLIDNREFRYSWVNPETQLVESDTLKIPMEWDEDIKEWLMTVEGVSIIEKIRFEKMNNSSSNTNPNK